MGAMAKKDNPIAHLPEIAGNLNFPYIMIDIIHTVPYTCGMNKSFLCKKNISYMLRNYK